MTIQQIEEMLSIPYEYEELDFNELDNWFDFNLLLV